ncbi:hypothetical protein C8J25_11350 [Sphingomonas faeni]|uniref:Uncharacterized protein n=1 Tax=Sphingomonas faeni TaxID=185950 RepID=A0A2T5TXI8_9SPHN|nr:hypothetical protein C8J25_11350 [Sphingomonas faeni]
MPIEGEIWFDVLGQDVFENHEVIVPDWRCALFRHGNVGCERARSAGPFQGDDHDLGNQAITNAPPKRQNARASGMGRGRLRSD